MTVQQRGQAANCINRVVRYLMVAQQVLILVHLRQQSGKMVTAVAGGVNHLFGRRPHLAVKADRLALTGNSSVRRR